MVNFAELVVGRDMWRSHEVLHVQLVSTAGARALLLGEPDLFFGNVGERGYRRQCAGRVNYDFYIFAAFQTACCCSVTAPYPVHPLRDKPDYHVLRIAPRGIRNDEGDFTLSDAPMQRSYMMKTIW